VSRFVLITRHPADCAELQELVRPHGVVIRPYPVLRLEELEDDRGWRQLAGAGAPDWLLMASPRAPQRFVDQARARGMEGLLARPAAAVGTTTADAVRAAGLDLALVGPGTGAGLAEQLVQRWTAATTAVFACGRHRRPELPDALEAAGHTVLPVEVYRMRATPPRELPPLPPSLEAVVLTSPRAARLYLEGVGGLPLPCQHVALGPTTRTAAAAIGIECRMPERPDMESLAEVLCPT
jgi:uroporphyrinogen-III synthase